MDILQMNTTLPPRYSFVGATLFHDVKTGGLYMTLKRRI